MASTPLERMASAHQAIRQGMDTITSACADLSARQHHQDSAFDQAAQAVDGCLDLARSAAQSASRMGGLVALIDDIAFQTNLVALNAGVEASRAGKAGKASRWWPHRPAIWPAAAPKARARPRPWPSTIPTRSPRSLP
jgi:methyl-accepting chemotaxis protein